MEDVVVTHLSLDLRVDFTEKVLVGQAKLSIQNKTAARQLVLDTRDLAISRVTLDAQDVPATFTLGQPQPYLGQPLIVDILPETRLVTIEYSTDPNAAAVQWLNAKQTASGQHPFLFTQSQAILARTWIPCQDSPGVRFTYDATIRTKAHLLAVMSAENGTEKRPDGVYHFEMNQPIPSYLLALAVGDLAYKPISDRCGIFAEPVVLDKAVWEFADTEKMIQRAEALYGPYRWERYDLLVLPPSFPFGGMENPRLTFVTPTVIAGDRSLTSLVAHELAHSWSGNLVTNANWNDFWLNEGFTTYFEHRIMEAVYGKDYAEMLAALSYQDLLTELGNLPEKDTHLHLDLQGRDPDDGMTSIAYDKGHFFLRTLEKMVGREKWDAFLRRYFDSHAFQTVTTQQFVSDLNRELIGNDAGLREKLQVDAWIYGRGIPGNVVLPHSDAFAHVEREIQEWLSGVPAGQLATSGWTTHHWLHFLRNLPGEMSKEQMTDLDETFHFTTTGNSEILAAWLLHAIANEYDIAYPALETFLTSMGRRKFLLPLYKRLAETPAGLKMAREIYRKARPGYHAISQGSIDTILAWGK